MEIECKELYPELSREQIEDWMEGEGIFSPQSFVAVSDEGKIIGFSVFEVYEIRGEEIIISLDAIAIEEKSQRQQIGSQLLIESTEKAKNHWNNNGFKVKGLIIETGTDEAGGFYEKVFPSAEEIVFSNIWFDGEGIILFFVHL